MKESGSTLLMALGLALLVGIVGAAVSLRLAQVAESRASSDLHKEYDIVRKHIGSHMSCRKTMTSVACRNSSAPPKTTCSSQTIDVVDEQDPTISKDDVKIIKKGGSMLTDRLKARACCSEGKLLVEVMSVDKSGNPVPDPLTKKLGWNQGTKSNSGWVHLYPGDLPASPNDMYSPCDLDRPIDVTYVESNINGPDPIRCISYYAQLGGWEELYWGFSGSASCPAGYKAVGEAIDCSKITVSPWYVSAPDQLHEGSYSGGAQQISDTSGTGFCCQSVNAFPAPWFLTYQNRFKLICQKS